MSFDAFFGNSRVVDLLRGMVAKQRLPQTLLFSGPRGVGKATVARLLAAAANCDQGPAADPCGACSNCRRMIAADLASEPMERLFAERLKMSAAKRLDNPLIVSTHPDLLIFPPDGPLRMITIEQARRLREAARFGPSEGRWRFFVVDHADRANEEAANALLKTLEEPAPKLTIILTAENPYDLLPTIRSRAIPFHFGPLSREKMAGFFATRPEIDSAEQMRLTGWAQGSPGRAVSLDVEAYTRRREAMLTLLGTAVGENSFLELLPATESVARGGGETLEALADSLYGLLQDLIHCKLGRDDLINSDLADRIAGLSRRISFPWVERAVGEIDEMRRLERRNIQKQIALESLALTLRADAAAS